MEVAGRGYVWVWQGQWMWLGELELLEKGLKIMKFKFGYISATFMCSCCCKRELLVTVLFHLVALSAGLE